MDIPENGSSNQGDKTIVEVDDSSTCGGKSETESPASSTPSRLDTTTDDYESADEGPPTPSHEVNLSVLASQLESLTLGTPKNPVSGRSGVIFPYSPLQETSVLLSSPEKEDDDPLDKTIGVSPIPVVDCHSAHIPGPVEAGGIVSKQNNLLEPVFKVPGAIVKYERHSVASTATGCGDDTFYTADSTFWSPSLDRSAVLTKSPEEDALIQNTVKTPDAVIETIPSGAGASERHTSSDIKSKSEHPLGDETLNRTPETDEILEIGVSPIPNVDCLSSYVPSPDECDGTVFAQNNQLDPAFKVPGSVVKQEHHSSASTTGKSDDTLPSLYHSANVTEDALNRKIVGTPSIVHDSNSSYASAAGQPTSPEINCESENPFEEEILDHTPNTDKLFSQSGEVKSPVSDFIAHADKITLREDSPLASSIQEKSYGKDLNLSLAPAQIDVDQIISKRHSTGLCKKDILPTEVVVGRRSFPEKLPEYEFDAVIESPDRRRSSTKYFLSVHEKSVSSKSLDETTDFSAELEVAKEVVDSCIADAARKYPNQNPSAETFTTDCAVSTNAGETEENRKVDEVCEGSEGPVKGTGAVYADDGSDFTVQVSTSHEADSPGIDKSLVDPAGGCDILTEAKPKPCPTPASLSFTQVPHDYSSGEVSLNSEASVSNNNTVIEIDDAITSNNPTQEYKFSLTSDGKSELHTYQVEGAVETDGIANLSSKNSESQEESLRSVYPSHETESQVLQTVTSGVYVLNSINCSHEVVASGAVDKEEEGVNIPRETPSSESTEVAVLAEQQSNAVTPIELKSDNLTFSSSDVGSESHRVEQVVASLTNNVSVEEKSTAPPNLSSAESSNVLLVKDVGIEDNPLFLNPTSDFISDAVTSSSLEDVVAQTADDAVGVNNGTENSEMRRAEQASEITKSEFSTSVETIHTEDQLVSSPNKIEVIKVESSTEPTSLLLGTPSEEDSRVGVVRSSKCIDEHVVGQSTEESTGVNVLYMTENSEVACHSEGSSENLPSPICVAHTNNSLGDEKSTNSSELTTNQACEFTESEASSSVETIRTENQLLSSPNKIGVIQVESSTEPTSQLLGTPSEEDSRVGVRSSECSNEHVLGQSAEESTGANVLCRTENSEVTCHSEGSSGDLPSPVCVAHTDESLGGEKSTNSSELKTNQACDFTESEASASVDTVGTENKLVCSLKAVDIAQIGNSTEPLSQLPTMPLKADSDAFSSIVVDFEKAMPTFGESYIVVKNEQASCTENKSLRTVDFTCLSGVQENPSEQDLTTEPMNLYCSPESTTDQCTSDDKNQAMERSYKDLSKLLATCSQQEQELGSRTFDFSCIQTEAAKIACDIIHSNDAKPTDQTQPMMQSSLSAETNNSEAGPITADEDINKEEFFNDASALDFEYLARAGNKQHCPSRLARQSLYVKFDPLVGKLIASSEDSNSSLVSAMADHNQSSGEEGKLDVTPPSHSEGDERLISITPATTKKEHRQSAGAHTPSLRQEISKLQELMIQQEQAHQEKADLVEELRSRIAELEATDNHRDSGDFEKKLKLKDDELRHAQDELEKAKGSNKQLIQVMEEYEKTISQLVTVKEETKAQMEKEKETIASERDTALQHLSNMEVAFNDIHQKYERAKTVIETLHANEKELKRSYDAVVETVEAQKVAYSKLKQHAAEKLTAANVEIEKVHKEYNGEMARMKAVAKKNELKCKSLEESLEQKKKELRELTQICDELIANHTPS